MVNAERWEPVAGFPQNGDITYHRGVLREAGGGEFQVLPVVRIAFNRPEVRNAFRPETVDQLYRALDHARLDPGVLTVILTGNGPSLRDGGWAFCSGGDQRVRGPNGYLNDGHDVAGGAGRLHILEVQRLIRTMPKPVIAVVDGWAAGAVTHFTWWQIYLSPAGNTGGLNRPMLTLAHLMVAMARHCWPGKSAKNEPGNILFGPGIFCQSGLYLGAVNEVADHHDLENLALDYARLIAGKSPTAIRMLKFAFNLADDGLAGQQVFAGEATRLAYAGAEAVEGRDAFLEHRTPDWSAFHQPT